MNWQQLSLREQRILIVGGSFVAILLGILFIIKPLITQISSKQIKLTSQESALQRLSLAKPWLMDKSQAEAPSALPSSMVLSTLDSTLKKPSMARYPASLNQRSDGKVQVQFATVSFDALMAWQNTLWRQYRLEAVAAEVTRLEASGMVKASITLSASQ